MRSRQSGFTLVEIAIVLVIIGLLLGGVLKGQELINSAKIKNLVNDMNGISTALYGYQDRFKALPGDDATAATRWVGSTTAGDGNSVLNVNGAPATMAAFNSNTATDESTMFWQHLRLAGFIGGAPNTNQPLNAVGGIMGVQFGAGSQLVAPVTQGLAGMVVCQSNILGRLAEALDNQLDDGIANSGSVRSWPQTALIGATGVADVTADITPTAGVGVSPEDAYIDDGNQMYLVCKRV